MIWESLRKFAKVCESLRPLVRKVSQTFAICRRKRAHARCRSRSFAVVCESLRKWSEVCESLRKFANVCCGLWQFTQICEIIFAHSCLFAVLCRNSRNVLWYSQRFTTNLEILSKSPANMFATLHHLRRFAKVCGNLRPLVRKLSQTFAICRRERAHARFRSRSFGVFRGRWWSFAKVCAGLLKFATVGGNLRQITQIYEMVCAYSCVFAVLCRNLRNVLLYLRRLAKICEIVSQSSASMLATLHHLRRFTKVCGSLRPLVRKLSQNRCYQSPWTCTCSLSFEVVRGRVCESLWNLMTVRERLWEFTKVCGNLRKCAKDCDCLLLFQAVCDSLRKFTKWSALILVCWQFVEEIYDMCTKAKIEEVNHLGHQRHTSRTSKSHQIGARIAPNIGSARSRMA